MKRLRILVLMHLDLVPPETMKGYTDAEIAQWKTEYDVVMTLREMGHEVRPLGVYDDLGVIRQAITEWRPHIAFNLLEEFHGNSLFDYHVVGFLELIKQPYTGCNPRGLLLAHDKALSKKILHFHRIRTPRFAVIPRGAVRPPPRLKFPLFVKSLIEQGSYGISQASIVNSEEKFRERVEYLQEKLSTPVIAEEYIEGRELYLAVIGNQRTRALPVIELKFGNLPEAAPRIATHKVKWDWRYQKEYGIDSRPAEDLEPRLVQKLQRLARRIYRSLDLSGYARIDLRLAPDGEVYVLEANANPDVAYGGELSLAAEAAGIQYEELLQRIVNLGLAYRPEARNF
jgi:D-alanine-D-alanine ligase